MLYDNFLRPLLFRMDPEKAHETMIGLLDFIQKTPAGPALLSWSLGANLPGLETSVFGLSFPNPVGLAAGFDKDCRLAAVLPSLGFGFIELGSVTLDPQPGNPRPRIFRAPEHGALINRLGFNSAGAQAAAASLKASGRAPLPLGVNLGLNAGCPKDEAARRYAETFRLLEPYADYFALNVSSPNTPGLRDLQERLSLERILLAIRNENKNNKPLLVKISPDLSEDKLPGLLELIGRLASGVIAGNTTLSREGLPGDYPEIRGGLSGAPLRPRSTALIAKIYALTQGKLPIIGVGGVFSGGDAFEKISAGASLVQLYTGLIYGGPRAVPRIQAELSRLLRQAGFKSVAQAVGTASRELSA